MSDNLLIVENLTKIYEGNTAAVQGISFAVPAGATYGLLGGNGAGKTTTLSMILGLLTPTSGKITIFDEDMPKQKRSLLARMNFSSPYVDMVGNLSVKENLIVFAHLYGLRDYKQRIDSLITSLQLEKFLNRQVRSLSAGQITRTSLAKSLINTPRLLVLDEPTASLDPDTADWVRTHLENYQREQNATILLASHNMGEVERMCNNILMMQNGKIVDRGTPRALIDKYGRQNMEEVFLHISRQGAIGMVEEAA
ncbi:MAG: ATP-binding cassette domain-containing protein [Alphaproteobacteria bacterium]|nr:ATP-binding cassette domain-containing protein [Alphaproteobacteria bacterium]